MKKEVHLSHKVSFIRQFFGLLMESPVFVGLCLCLFIGTLSYGFYRFVAYLQTLPEDVAKAILDKVFRGCLFFVLGILILGIVFLLCLCLHSSLKKTIYLTNVFRDAPLSLEEMAAIGANTTLEQLLVMSCYLLLPNPLFPRDTTFAVREYSTERVLPRNNPMFMKKFPYSTSYCDSLAVEVCSLFFPHKDLAKNWWWNEQQAEEIALKGKSAISEDVRDWCIQILAEHHVLESYKQQSKAEKCFAYSQKQPILRWSISSTPFLLLFLDQ